MPPPATQTPLTMCSSHRWQSGRASRLTRPRSTRCPRRPTPPAAARPQSPSTISSAATRSAPTWVTGPWLRVLGVAKRAGSELTHTICVNTHFYARRARANLKQLFRQHVYAFCSFSTHAPRARPRFCCARATRQPFCSEHAWLNRLRSRDEPMRARAGPWRVDQRGAGPTNTLAATHEQTLPAHQIWFFFRRWMLRVLRPITTHAADSLVQCVGNASTPLTLKYGDTAAQRATGQAYGPWERNHHGTSQPGVSMRGRGSMHTAAPPVPSLRSLHSPTHPSIRSLHFPTHP